MTLTTPMKIIIAILLIGLIGAGFYVLDYKQKWEELAARQKELSDSEAGLAKIKEEIKALPQLTKQVEDKEKELQALVQNRTQGEAEKPELFVANYIAEIERMVISQQESTGDYDFDIVSLTPGAAAAAPSAAPSADGKAPPPGDAAAPAPEALQGFPTRVFNMSITGKYSTLVDFLYQLGAMKLDRLVTINKISLSPQAKAEGGSPVLTITIPVTAYMKTGN